MRRNSLDNMVEDEVERFLKDECTNVQILDEYPSIRNVFFRHNTTLSASGAVEWIFSQSKLIYTPNRNRFSAENFEKSLTTNHSQDLI